MLSCAVMAHPVMLQPTLYCSAGLGRRLDWPNEIVSGNTGSDNTRAPSSQAPTGAQGLELLKTTSHKRSGNGRCFRRSELTEQLAHFAACVKARML